MAAETRALGVPFLAMSQHRSPFFLCRGFPPGGFKVLDDGIPMNLIQLSAWPSCAGGQMRTWICRPTSVIGDKADMARPCQYVR